MFCCVVMSAAVELLEAERLSGLLSLSFVGTQRWSLVSLSSATKLPPAGKLGPPSLGWFTRWGPYSSFDKITLFTQDQVVRVIAVWESGVQCTAEDVMALQVLGLGLTIWYTNESFYFCSRMAWSWAQTPGLRTTWWWPTRTAQRFITSHRRFSELEML